MNELTEQSWSVIEAALGNRKHLRQGFKDLVQRSEDTDLDYLLDLIDESDYSAEDWAESLIVFDSWLEEQKIEGRPLRAMMGYVHCCTLMNAPQISLPSLKVIVYQSLTEFGFEAVSDPQI